VTVMRRVATRPRFNVLDSDNRETESLKAVNAEMMNEELMGQRLKVGLTTGGKLHGILYLGGYKWRQFGKSYRDGENGYVIVNIVDANKIVVEGVYYSDGTKVEFYEDGISLKRKGKNRIKKPKLKKKPAKEERVEVEVEDVVIDFSSFVSELLLAFEFMDEYEAEEIRDLLKKRFNKSKWKSIDLYWGKLQEAAELLYSAKYEQTKLEQALKDPCVRMIIEAMADVHLGLAIKWRNEMGLSELDIVDERLKVLADRHRASVEARKAEGGTTEPPAGTEGTSESTEPTDPREGEREADRGKDSDTEGKEKPDKPDGLPRTVLQEVVDGEVVDMDMTKAHDSDLELYKANWERMAKEAGLELTVERKSPKDLPADVDPKDASRVVVEGNKLKVIIYTLTLIGLEHETKIIEAACLEPHLFEEITSSNVETVQEIMAESMKAHSRKSQLQLALLNAIELTAIASSIEKGNLSEGEESGLRAEHFYRALMHKELLKKLKLDPVNVSIQSLYDGYKKAGGQPITRLEKTFKGRLKALAVQRYGYRTFGQVMGMEAMQLGASLFEFLPAVFVSDMVIQTIESGFTKPFDVMLEEFAAKMATKEFWINYGYFHYSGVGLEFFKLDEKMAEKLAKIFRQGTDKASLARLNQLLKPNLKMAATFVIVNVIHNWTEAAHMWKTDTDKSGLQKTFKFAEMIVSRGWIKVGVDIGIFLGVPVALQAAGFSLGPLTGVATLAITLTAVHFADKPYRKLEDLYRGVEQGIYEDDIVERLINGDAVNEVTDHMKDRFTLLPQGDIESFAQGMQELKHYWGILTGESTAPWGDKEQILGWYFTQWSELNNLRRMYIMQKVMAKVQSTENWYNKNVKKAHDKLTGSAGFVGLNMAIERKNSQYSWPEYLELYTMARMMNFESIPTIAEHQTEDEEYANKSFGWTNEGSKAWASYMYINNDLRKKLGVASDANSWDDERELVEAIQKHEADKIKGLSEGFRRRWFEDVNRTVHKQIPELLEAIEQERVMISMFMESIKDDAHPHFMDLALNRLEAIGEEEAQYKKMLDDNPKTYTEREIILNPENHTVYGSNFIGKE